MGSPIGPTCANLYMHTHVDDHLLKIPGVVSTYRYLDDIFFIIQGKENALKLQDELNKIDPPYMRFTVEIDEKQVSFLDVMVYKEGDHLLVRPYTKPANKFLYLPFVSFHADNNKLGFIKTELQRLARNSSKVEDYYSSAREFVKNLVARGYKRSFIARAVGSIQYADRELFLRKKEKPKIDDANAKVMIYKTHLDVDTRNKRLQGLIRQTLLDHPPDPVVFDVNRDRVIFALTKSPSFSSLLINNTGTINPLDRFKKKDDKNEEKNKSIIPHSMAPIAQGKLEEPIVFPVVSPNVPPVEPDVINVEDISSSKEITIITRIGGIGPHKPEVKNPNNPNNPIAVIDLSAPKRQRTSASSVIVSNQPRPSLYSKPVPKPVQYIEENRIPIATNSPPSPSSITIEVLPDDENIMDDEMSFFTYPDSRTSGRRKLTEPTQAQNELETTGILLTKCNAVKRKRSITSSPAVPVPAIEMQTDSSPPRQKVRMEYPAPRRTLEDLIRENQERTSKRSKMSTTPTKTATTTTTTMVVKDNTIEELPNTIVGNRPPVSDFLRQHRKNSPRSNPVLIATHFQIAKVPRVINRNRNSNISTHNNLTNRSKDRITLEYDHDGNEIEIHEYVSSDEEPPERIFPTYLSTESERPDVADFLEKGRIYVYEGPEVAKYFRFNPRSQFNTYVSSKTGQYRSFTNHENTPVEWKLICTDYSRYDNFAEDNEMPNRKFLYIHMNGVINWRFKKSPNFVRTSYNDIPYISRHRLNWNVVLKYNMKKIM